MAVRYYYFRAEPFDLAGAQAKMALAAGLASVAPEVTQPAFQVVTLADDTAPNEDDLFAAMAAQGLTFVASTLVAPVFGQVRHHGALAVAPTTPAPATGDRYYDTAIGWELQFDGASFKSVQFVTMPFTFATASPLVLTPLRATDFSVRALVQVSTPFDGVGASLTLGSAGSPTGILAAAEVGVTVADFYPSMTPFVVGVASNLQLTIVPGAGATAGAGRVFLEIWRA